MEAAIDAGADDVSSDEANHVVTCAFESIGEVSSAMAAKFGDAETVKVVWKPNVMAPLSEFEKAESLMKLVDMLDEDDDVQNVFTNADIPDEIAAKLS
jgi:transcriptional/translational regulatory protein YebC/TACO1